MKNPYSQYRKNQVENASREDLLIQLYEAAIGSVRQARELWASSDHVTAREKLMRGLDIVYELDSTLDREQGAEVVERLEALYDFLEREITQANLKGEFERLGAVQDVLETLYRGWREAVLQIRAQQSADSAQPAQGVAG